MALVSPVGFLRVLSVIAAAPEPSQCASFRVGEYGGYMIVETDNLTDIHYLTSVFAVFEFKVEPVVDVMDAVAAEVQAIEYRKKNAP